MPFRSLDGETVSFSYEALPTVSSAIGFIEKEHMFFDNALQWDNVTNNFTSWKLENKIKKVIFNGPATIILWTDGTKTVVKCKEGDSYSKEAGFALCVLKRMLHNDGGTFHQTIKKWCKD